MSIVHISAECYPIAKVGGLADVVGALPKYQNKLGIKSSVVMPFYDNTFTQTHDFVSVFTSKLNLGEDILEFNILKTEDNELDFDVFFVDVKSLLFKDYVYSFDDTDRFLAFQIAALDWLLTLNKKPSIIHCHDHHTGLIPFMTQECNKYKAFRKTPTIITIHNAQYQGWFSYNKLHLLPEFDVKNIGLLDWDGTINPLAAGIKCAWRVTTVSPTYMIELKTNANGLESLLSHEHKKCLGILNGIDTQVWNPETDNFIIKKYSEKTIQSGKKANKAYLCKEFNLDVSKPLFIFIGRLVGEKGADVFPEAFEKILNKQESNILVLGSGIKTIETELNILKEKFSGIYFAYIGYNERLSHIMYAGADFLLMPSRVEPCGLNQMYSLRYGTIPIVRSIGGLKDTVVDIDDDGFGICHQDVSVTDIVNAASRATTLYSNSAKLKKIKKEIMQIDHSWDVSAKAYLKLYNSIN